MWYQWLEVSYTQAIMYRLKATKMNVNPTNPDMHSPPEIMSRRFSRGAQSSWCCYGFQGTGNRIDITATHCLNFLHRFTQIRPFFNSHIGHAVKGVPHSIIPPCTCKLLEIIIIGGGTIQTNNEGLSSSGAEVDNVVVVVVAIGLQSMGIRVGAGVS